MDEHDTFQCSGCLVEYGDDLLHMTCGECAADFCKPCWTKHYDTKKDEAVCVTQAEADADHPNCPGTVGGDMCHHPSHKEGRRE